MPKINIVLNPYFWNSTDATTTQYQMLYLHENKGITVLQKLLV